MPKCWRLKTRELKLESVPLLMGILNATPDSFSDGGRFRARNESALFEVDIRAVVEAGRRLVQEGAAILDVGGESTRPGSEPVSEAEELRRVVPTVAALVRNVDVPVSIDTYRPGVADAALEVGAEIVNDVAAGRFIGAENRFASEEETDFPEELAEVARRRGASVVLTAARGIPKGLKEETYGSNVVEEVLEFLKRRRDRFVELGVPLERLAFDPGIGFGKTTDQNWLLIREAKRFHELGGVVLFGCSRKRFLVETARKSAESSGIPFEDSLEARDSATSATTRLLTFRADVLRVHNVALNAEAIEQALRAEDGR